MSEYKHEVIFCIVNAGFSEAVMDSARQFGASGGTVLHARGTANPEAEKEIVLILVEADKKDDILLGLYNAVGLKTPGYGIAFSMPVSNVVGISQFNKEDK